MTTIFEFGRVVWASEGSGGALSGAVVLSLIKLSRRRTEAILARQTRARGTRRIAPHPAHDSYQDAAGERSKTLWLCTSLRGVANMEQHKTIKLTTMYANARGFPEVRKKENEQTSAL